MTWISLTPSSLPVGKPKNDLFLFKIKHYKFDVRVIFIDELISMHNGWQQTDHTMPGFTKWDGYKHVLPKDAFWKPYLGSGTAEQIIGLDGIGLKDCPFCGKQPKWRSHGGFVGSRPFQEDTLSLSCCVIKIHDFNPEKCIAAWNSRA